MDTLNDFPADFPWLEISIFFFSLLFVFTIFSYAVLNNGDERPVTFNVSIPEQCSPEWKGEVLDEPSIKASPSTHIPDLQKD
jgi:hypothetical protein